MDCLFSVVTLSETFWFMYPHSVYTELMEKENRPYSCLLLKTKYDFYICIPFRSSIKHNQAILFKKSERSRKTRSGLDYSKLVVFRDTSYISDCPGIVDSDEFKETRERMDEIIKCVTDYIDRYREY